MLLSINLGSVWNDFSKMQNDKITEWWSLGMPRKCNSKVNFRIFRYNLFGSFSIGKNLMWCFSNDTKIVRLLLFELWTKTMKKYLSQIKKGESQSKEGSLIFCCKQIGEKICFEGIRTHAFHSKELTSHFSVSAQAPSTNWLANFSFEQCPPTFDYCSHWCQVDYYPRIKSKNCSRAVNCLGWF